jgi:hypothetical protein
MGGGYLTYSGERGGSRSVHGYSCKLCVCALSAAYTCCVLQRKRVKQRCKNQAQLRCVTTSHTHMHICSGVPAPGSPRRCCVL